MIYFNNFIFNTTRLLLLLFINFYFALACTKENHINFKNIYDNNSEKTSEKTSESNYLVQYGVNRNVLDEDEGFLQIPGVGWQTFRSFNCPHVGNYNFYPGAFYTRWYWESLEPVEGEYAFAEFDALLERCRNNNMALCFRFQIGAPQSGNYPWEIPYPEWLSKKGATIVDGLNTLYNPPREFSMPDLDCPIVWEYHEKLIRAFGQRYNGHPDLAMIDIGTVGNYGEWHTFGSDPDMMPSEATLKAIIDLYHEVFPDTPLTMLAHGHRIGQTYLPYMSYAVERGNCGWRADGFGSPAAHQKDPPGPIGFYREIHNTYSDAWKAGPVAFEPRAVWGSDEYPPDEVVDDAIDWHATFIMNKQTVIPEGEWMTEMERLMKIIGFRLVLRELIFDAYDISAGNELTVKMDLENIGIAPPYRDHRIAFRLRDNNNAKHAITITNQSIRGWLPGEINVSEKYLIPQDMPAGDYNVEMGLVFHSSIGHNIPIANQGKTEDGWYILGGIRVLK